MKRSCRFIRVIVFTLVSFIVASCAGQVEKPPSPLNDGISTATPESLKLPANSFSSISKKVFDSRKSAKFSNTVSASYYGVDSILIMYQDHLVYEKYFNQGSRNKPHLMASLGKSLLSAIVGIAIDQGHVKSVDESIFPLLPFKLYRNDDHNKQAIQLKHLLTMSSGWQCGGVEDYAKHCGVTMMQKQNPIKWALDLPMAWQPGSRFNYNEAEPRIASAIISIQTGQHSADYGKQYLLQPLGISENAFQTGKLTSRDMLKIGLLYLHKGYYKGQQLISEDWVQQSTSVQFPFKSAGKNKGYGYYWWLRDFHIDGEVYSSFYAAGNGGQYLFVVPGLDLVVALTGSNYGHFKRMQKFIELVENHILPPVAHRVN